MLFKKPAWLISNKEYEGLIQEHWEMVRDAHFNKSSGTPYWINKLQEHGINPNSLHTLQDFLNSPISLCDESMINQKPISYFIPKSTSRRGLV